MSTLQKRVEWAIIHNIEKGVTETAVAIIKELETTHKIVDPDFVSPAMLNACYQALPEHYDPPDPKRLPWHAFKAKRRYAAMAKAAPSIVEK